MRATMPTRMMDILLNPKPNQLRPAPQAPQHRIRCMRTPTCHWRCQAHLQQLLCTLAPQTVAAA